MPLCSAREEYGRLRLFAAAGGNRPGIYAGFTAGDNDFCPVSFSVVKPVYGLPRYRSGNLVNEVDNANKR